MPTIKDYAVTREIAEKALAEDFMELADYDATVLGLVNDGVDWQVLEDSLDAEEALAWARRAESYGEHVGLFEWSGAV